MISSNNLKILNTNYNNTLKHINSIYESLNNNLIKIEDTKKDCKTLYIEREGKKSYIHSKYDPIREAKSIAEEYSNIEPNGVIIFYGTGLGYHIDEILENNKNNDFYIYEPVNELMIKFLENYELKKLPNKNLKNIGLGNTEESIISFLGSCLDKSAGNIKIVTLPSHQKIFIDEYNTFMNSLKEYLKTKKSNIYTDMAFQERWTINSIINFKHILKTPNLLLDESKVFHNKPVILVSAGPSLNEEIDNLRYIKKNKLAYIFSVGSAINTLLHHGIYPDATIAYDPKDHIWVIFKEMINQKISEIPLIFGSSIGHKAIDRYLGEKLHVITSQDTVASYYLKDADSKPIPYILDAPSVAIIALQLLDKLKVNRIFLVGQNLALKGDKDYSEGISYRKDGKSKQIENNNSEYIIVKDVYGNDIKTLESYNKMRQEMEMYIRSMNGVEIINTTKAGASINGTKFMNLNEVIKDLLTEPVVNPSWINEISSFYDIDFLINQKKMMDKEYIRAQELLKDYEELITKIENKSKIKDFSNIDKLYINLDKLLRKTENNRFFKVFILPMNRINYKKLVDSIDVINKISNQFQKADAVIINFKEFIFLSKESFDKVEALYFEMNDEITNLVLKKEERN